MAASVGMSVPGASDLGGGFGGGQLSDQVSGETEEERRRRLLAQQQGHLLPNAGSASLGLSVAGYSSLFGR